MYLLLVIAVYIIFAILFVDWKRWKDYYSTVQFYMICNLLYNFLFYQHTLWAYKPKTVAWLNHTFIELTFTFFIIPVVLMIYLRYFPKGWKKASIYVGLWVVYFSFIEILFSKRGLFIYDNGWNEWWSTLFNIIMFTVIRIHFRNPLRGLTISLPIIILLLFIFHPSLSDLK